MGWQDAPVVSTEPSANASAGNAWQSAPVVRQNVGAEPLRRNYAGSEVPLAALVNAPGSAAEQIAGLYNVVTSPLQTLETVSQGIGGGFITRYQKKRKNLLQELLKILKG
jgi:hypothetical protein